MAPDSGGAPAPRLPPPPSLTFAGPAPALDQSQTRAGSYHSSQPIAGQSWLQLYLKCVGSKWSWWTFGDLSVCHVSFLAGCYQLFQPWDQPVYGPSRSRRPGRHTSTHPSNGPQDINCRSARIVQQYSAWNPYLSFCVGKDIFYVCSHLLNIKLLNGQFSQNYQNMFYSLKMSFMNERHASAGNTEGM